MRLYPYLCEAEAGGFLDLWEFLSQPGQPTEVLSHLTKWNKLELGMGMRRHASSASSRPYLHIWVVFLLFYRTMWQETQLSLPRSLYLSASGTRKITTDDLNFQSNMPRKRLVSQPGPGFLFVQANPGQEWAVFQVSGQLWRILSSKCVCCYCVYVHIQKELLSTFLNWSSLLKLRAHTVMDGVSRVSIRLITFLAGLIRHVDNMKLLSKYTRFLIF